MHISQNIDQDQLFYWFSSISRSNH